MLTYIKLIMHIEGRGDPILISTNDVGTRIIFVLLASCFLSTIADIKLADEKDSDKSN